MKSVEEQLSRYKSVHFNKKNVQTHFIGVPLIVWAITLLLSLSSIDITLLGITLKVTAAKVFFTIALLYYFKLHWRIALGMVLYIIPNVYFAEKVAAIDNAYLLAIIIFVIGWVIQFIGHYFEKAKPAFIDDLSQFLIGPFFLMAEIYFALGCEKKLHNDITPLARDRRKAIEGAKRVVNN